MPGNTALAMLKQEPRLVSITARQSSALIFMIVPSRVMPALLTRMSTGPSASATARTPA